ncbi:hypothetical protein HYS91_05150 [Candidatus Daviesbacteria bacterium]|nr:hypothetical protein [Candidatus Daviesbacteria bacterium]
MLTQPEIEDFKQITLKVYGIKLSDAEARDQGERLIRVMELMAQTLKPKDLIHKLPVDRKK